MVNMDKQFVYYIANEDKLSVVNEYTHEAFLTYTVEKFNPQALFWDKYSDLQDAYDDILKQTFPDIVFLGEL